MSRHGQRVIELDPYYGDGRNAQSYSEINLENIEQSIRSSLPSDYREFLTHFGGVGFRSQPIFTFQERNNPSSQDVLDSLYGVLPENPYGDVATEYHNHQGRIPSVLLPIGYDPGGNIICLGLKGEQRGKVYFWDHEREEMPPDNAPPDWEPGYSNVSFIANSFDEFFFSLKPQEDY